MPNITTLPYAISAAGTYTIIGPLTCNSGTAITVSTTGTVIIEGGGNTITWSVTARGCVIAKEYTAGNLTVNALTMTQGAYNLTGTEKSYGIYVAGQVTSLTVTNCTFNITKSTNNSAYTRAICYNDTSGTASIALTVTGSTFNIGGAGNACGIQVDPQTGAHVTLTGEISGCTFAVTENQLDPARGYCVQIDDTSDIANSTAFEIHNNQFTGSSEVRSYNFLCPGSAKVYLNTFTISSLHCHAMRCGNYSKIYSNTFTISSANPSADYISGAISIRYGAHDNEVYENTINCTGAYCIPYSCGGSEDVVYLGPPYNNNFHDNDLSYHGLTAEGTGSGGGSHNNQFTANTYTNLDGVGYDIKCNSYVGGATAQDTGYFTEMLFTDEVGLARVLCTNSGNVSYGGDATFLRCGSPTITITGTPAPRVSQGTETSTLSTAQTVAGIQFDITTPGSPWLTLNTSNFAFDYGVVTGNTLRVLVWPLGNYTFTGNFMYIRAGAITAITNVIGSDIDGNLVAGTTVTATGSVPSAPQNLRLVA